MKFNFSGIFIIFLLASLFLHCESKEKKIDTSKYTTPKVEKIVTVYGSENCDHCLEFRKQADSMKIKYTFKDCEASEQNYNELALKIQQARIPGYISFPVIEINGKLYIRPEFDQFIKLISE